MNRLVFSVKRAICILLAPPGFVVGEVVAVGDDDVVHEVDAHQLAGALDALGQLVVPPAGREAARGMVVTGGEDGGIRQDGLPDDDADVDGSLRDAAV